MSDSGGSTGGVGLATVLTIVFVVLKLTDVIDWSWWWVLSPTLIDVGLLVFLLLSALLAKASDRTWTDDPDAGEDPWTWPEGE